MSLCALQKGPVCCAIFVSTRDHGVLDVQGAQDWPLPPHSKLSDIYG